MKLTVYYDGQFYVGVIEMASENTLKAYRCIFGQEPKDQEILEFTNSILLPLIERKNQNGIAINQVIPKKVNPKRLQRIVSKETKQKGISTKAEEAIKEEYTKQKKEKSLKNKQLRNEQKQYIRELKVQKAKNKHRGK